MCMFKVRVNDRKTHYNIMQNNKTTIKLDIIIIIITGYLDWITLVVGVVNVYVYVDNKI